MGGFVLDGSEVAFEVVDDCVVTGRFGVPSAGVGVGFELFEVVDLGVDCGGELGRGCVVVALLADVGVGACAGGEVAGAVAVSDTCFDHFGVEPFDSVRNEVAAGSGNEAGSCGGFRDRCRVVGGFSWWVRAGGFRLRSLTTVSRVRGRESALGCWSPGHCRDN